MVENIWQLLRKLNKELPSDPEIPLGCEPPRKPKMRIRVHTCAQMLAAATFATAKGGNNPDHWQMDGETKWGVVVTVELSSHKKEGSPNTHDNGINVENMLSERSRHNGPHIVQFHSYEVSRLDTARVRVQLSGARGWGEGGGG